MTAIVDGHHHIWRRDDLVGAFRSAAERLRPDQREAIFNTTATRLYRLQP
jgi:predicted TIM-barrel fold metal-dependent hydrolase